MDRKGISFTLTVVVAGVVLLMSALSIITLGGSSIQQFFNTVTGESQQAQARAQCNELANRIDRQYCTDYVQWIGNGQYSCSSSQEERATDFNRTANAEDCNWRQNSQFSPTITVNGESYDCVQEGYISDTTCPAG